MTGGKKAPARLGRGLAALLGETAVPRHGESPSALRLLSLDLLEPNPFQPRVTSDPQALEELAASIRTRGVLQPLLARPHPSAEGRFQLVAGERRWKAAAMAGLHEVPVIIREMPDADAATAALIENLQREDLNPMEEAEGYSRLVDELGLTQEKLAEALGKSRSHITNVMRLLNLPIAIQQEVHKGTLSFGHARALLSHADPESAMARVFSRKLTVRETEALGTRRSAAAKQRLRQGSVDVAAMERRITEQLGCPARITLDEKGGGALNLQFAGLEQLESWLARLLPD